MAEKENEKRQVKKRILKRIILKGNELTKVEGIKGDNCKYVS